MLPSLTPLIIARHQLPFRRVETVDGPMWVPRYIRASGQYWRVVIDRVDEPLFDEWFTDHNRALGLDKAIERLHDVLPEYTPYDCLRNRLTRYYYVHEYVRKGLTQIRVHARVCSHNRTVRTMSFWAGTENTITQSRLDHCIARAIGTRVWAGQMIRDCGRSVLLHEPLPNHIEDYAND